MITIEQTDNLVNAAVLGEFTLADFKAFEEQSLFKLKSPGELNLLFDLRAMIDYTLDVAWEEIKFFSSEHNHDFSRIAVVTSDQWIAWQAWLSRIFVDADICVFADYDEAMAWVSA
ncbi:MAG: STAS/SEC14 domain-containing protein [Nitrosomonadales bacterium]|nr:STAS/SEC14 domain-containing protein [Nitrosomonadales bacterium]